MKDEEWTAWQDAYRSGGDLPVEVRDIVRNARRDRWMQVGKLTIDVVAYAAGAISLVLLSARLPQIWPIAALLVPAFVAALAYAIHARQGTWERTGRSAREFVDLEHRRKVADARLYLASKVLFVVLVAGLCVWIPYLVASKGRPVERLAPIGLALFFSFVTLGATWVLLARKHRAAKERVARLAALRDALGEG